MAIEVELTEESERFSIRKIRLSEETVHAMRAFAQWEFGDPDWAELFLNLIRSDNPQDDVRTHIGNENDFGEVWKQTERG